MTHSCMPPCIGRSVLHAEEHQDVSIPDAVAWYPYIMAEHSNAGNNETADFLSTEPGPEHSWKVSLDGKVMASELAPKSKSFRIY